MNFTLLLPEILLTILAFAIILIGLLISNKSKNMLGYLSAAGLLASLVYVLGNGMTQKMSYFYDSLVVDPLSQVFKLIAIRMNIMPSFSCPRLE
jgi:NADH-quinone oxidoreductase subunit N